MSAPSNYIINLIVDECSRELLKHFVNDFLWDSRAELRFLYKQMYNYATSVRGEFGEILPNILCFGVYMYVSLWLIYTKRANIRRNFAEYSRKLLLHNYALVSMEAVYTKSEISPRIRRELAERKIIRKKLQELARIDIAANISL